MGIHKKWIIATALLIGGILVMPNQSVHAETEMTSLTIEIKGTEEVVNIKELGQRGYQFSFVLGESDHGRTAVLSGNGRVVEFTEHSPFALVEGKRAPLSVETTTDGALLPQWTDGIFIEDGQVYAPVSFVSKVFDLTERNGELVFEEGFTPVELIEEPENDEQTESVDNEQILPEIEAIESETELIEEEAIEDVKEILPEEPATEEPKENSDDVNPIESPQPTPTEEEKPDEAGTDKEKGTDTDEEVVDEAESITDAEWETVYKEATLMNGDLIVRKEAKTIEIDILLQQDTSPERLEQVKQWIEKQRYAVSTEETLDNVRFIIKRSLK